MSHRHVGSAGRCAPGPRGEKLISKRAAVYGRRMPNKAGPIDPASSPKWALAGRIVTLDANSTVVMDGAIWIADAAIAAITKRGDPAPEGFADITPLETGGTVLPGLIELH